MLLFLVEDAAIVNRPSHTIPSHGHRGITVTSDNNGDDLTGVKARGKGENTRLVGQLELDVLWDTGPEVPDGWGKDGLG